MTGEALLGPGSPDTVLARRDGLAISRRQYLADAAALAERLPNAGAMLNLSVDRYRFAVGLGAALLRGHTCLLPPNHTAHTVARLRARFAGVYALVEAGGDGDGLPLIVHGGPARPAPAEPVNPLLAADRVAACVLTSGSTGDPVPHAKPWGLLAASARAEAARLAQAMGRDSLAGVTLVATVPPQHMYGFESSVLIALHGGAAFDAGRPFYPADIVATLAATPSPRALVTTPFHLKALLESGLAMPRVELVLCATAPLSPQLAGRAEAAFAAPLVEIYGCTEAGQVATRRTTAGAEWRTFDGLVLSGNDEHAIVSGGHVPESTPLADVLEVLGPDRFRLLGRSNDLVNIAGKRSSLSHLDFHLNAIAGVVDGAFWVPPESAEAPGVVRLVAFVVAPGLGREQILAGLRTRIDAAFLPRRIVAVDALPREPTGKLTVARLAKLAAVHGLRSDRVAMDVHLTHRFEIAVDHPAFAGHFPGRPMLPGVALVAEAMEAASAEPMLARAIGPAPRLSVVKFLAPVRPGAALEIAFRLEARAIVFSIGEQGRVVATGQFARVDLDRGGPP